MWLLFFILLFLQHQLTLFIARRGLLEFNIVYLGLYKCVITSAMHRKFTLVQVVLTGFSKEKKPDRFRIGSGLTNELFILFIQNLTRSGVVLAAFPFINFLFLLFIQELYSNLMHIFSWFKNWKSKTWNLKLFEPVWRRNQTSYDWKDTRNS